MDHRALVMTRVALILGVPFLLWELGSYPRGLCMGSVAALRGKPVLMIQGSVGSAPKYLFPIYREWYSLSIRRRGGLARPGTDNWYASGHGAATSFWVRQRYGADAFDRAREEADRRREAEHRRWAENAARSGRGG